jgi:hypothetical protein
MYPHERSLVEHFRGRPFALLGVNSDGDREYVKQAMQRAGINWRSWWDGPRGTSGPIAQAWQVKGWPSLFLIDASGVIRLRPEQYDGNVRNLERLIERLVKEAGKA